MNTWRDACELQEQKLNLILTDHSRKAEANISIIADVVKEN
jgi:hypothetical protein